MSDNNDAWSSLNRADQLPAEVNPRPRKAVPQSKAVLESSVSRSEHTPDDLDPTTEPSSKPIKDPKEDPKGNPPTKTHTPASQDPSSSDDKPDPPPADHPEAE